MATTLYDHADGAPALHAFARAHQVFLVVARCRPHGFRSPWVGVDRVACRYLVARAGGRTVASCNITPQWSGGGGDGPRRPGVDGAAAWVEAGAAVAGLAPHAPVVAWSPAGGVAAAVAAGWAATGPMRVWSR